MEAPHGDRPGRGVIALMNSIKARDLEKIRQILKRLEQGSKLSPSVPSDATHALEWRTDLTAEVRFLIEISEALAAITYKKGSAKDRFRDLPWPNLEYLHIVLKEALQASGASQDDAAESQHRDVRWGLCAIAVPLIIKEDLPELHTRLSTLLRHQEEELAVFGGSITEESVLRTVVTAPPATGLVRLVKLTQHFMDEMQLRTLLGHMSPLTSSSYTGSRLQKYALMRLLTIVGESTKYMSPHLKAADPTIPWKNIEKVRDLLGHVSRVPIREAVQSILEEREVRGANLAEDATTAVAAAAGPPSEESMSPQATTTTATQTTKKNAKAKAKATTLKSEEGEELGFARTVIPLPPNLLRDVYERELVALGRKFDALRRHHASFLFEPPSAHPLSFILFITSLVFVAAAIFLFFTTPPSSSSPSSPSSSPSSYLAAGLLGGVMFGVSAGPLWRDGGDGPQQRRRRGAAALWRALPRAAAYAPQSLALKRYSKLKERELEEKLRRDDDNARRHNNPDDDEVELMLRELATAMRQKRLEGGEGDNDDDEGHDQADDDEKAAAAAAAVDVYRRALRREAQLDKAQAKELWALVTDKSARKRWAERLYGKARSTKRVKPKAPDHHHSDDDDDDDAGEVQCHSKTGNSRKLARVRKLVALHQNSTLNKEGKRNHHDGDELGNFVLLRKFLQNPTETKEDQSTLCVKFIIATLREVQQLMADELPAFLAWALHSGGGGGGGDDDEERRVVEEATRQIREHPLLQYALHFQIGLYALYAAQVKWWYPRLLGVEHIEMRDSVMHGTGHSYAHHLTDAGIAGMLGHLALMLRARAGLEAALLDLRTHAT